MSDFGSVFSAAQQLPNDDRRRLLDALWETELSESEAPFSKEWEAEIERRLAELDAGTAKLTPWSQVRDEAMTRVGYGKSN